MRHISTIWAAVKGEDCAVAVSPPTSWCRSKATAPSEGLGTAPRLIGLGLDCDKIRPADVLSRTEAALVELDGFLKNAEVDLEAEIAEASEGIGDGEIALLPDRAATHCERIARLNQQIAFHAKVRDKLKVDLNSAAMGCKRAIDHLEVAKRPLLQQVSARIADEIEILEAKSSALRDQLRGMSNSATGRARWFSAQGLDDDAGLRAAADRRSADQLAPLAQDKRLGFGI